MNEPFRLSTSTMEALRADCKRRGVPFSITPPPTQLFDSCGKVTVFFRILLERFGLGACNTLEEVNVSLQAVWSDSMLADLRDGPSDAQTNGQLGPLDMFMTTDNCPGNAETWIIPASPIASFPSRIFHASTLLARKKRCQRVAIVINQARVSREEVEIVNIGMRQGFDSAPLYCGGWDSRALVAKCWENAGLHQKFPVPTHLYSTPVSVSPEEGISQWSQHVTDSPVNVLICSQPWRPYYVLTAKRWLPKETAVCACMTASSAGEPSLAECLRAIRETVSLLAR